MEAMFGLQWYALTAGMVAAFNPCGFAMLPAYLTMFVADPSATAELEAGPSSDRIRVVTQRLWRAALVGTVVTAGFVVVFGIVGGMLLELTSLVRDAMPWMSIVIGIAMACVGIAMLFGFEPKIAVPRLERGGDRGLRGMFLYGMSYATVSLGCAITPFAAAVISTGFRTKGFGAGVSRLVSYSIGMGLVIIVLTLAVALAQQAFVKGLRRVLPYIHRVSAVLLTVAGIYVAFYGWYSRAVLNGGSSVFGSSLFDWIDARSASMTELVSSVQTSLLAAVIVGVVGLVAWLGYSSRRQSKN
jgi:cytochrome c-type biogenesis protein